MTCKEHNDLRGHVVDTRQWRHAVLGVVIRRRRECGQCDHRWTTYEMVAEKFRESADALAIVRNVKRTEWSGE